MAAASPAWGSGSPVSWTLTGAWWGGSPVFRSWTALPWRIFCGGSSERNFPFWWTMTATAGPLQSTGREGMILDGKLFRGSNGASGESGHMLAAVSGEERIPCMCGNSGCFNSLCSGKAIVSHVRRWLAAGEESILPSLAGGAEKITARHISEACEKGDALAVRAVGQMAHYMAMWIFNVYMLLNVDCIVFSGGLLAMGEKLFGKMREEFESCHTNGFPVEFKFTELGEDSGLIGAACLLSDQVRPTR